MTRTPEIKPETLSPAQKAVYDKIVSGPRGQVIGPLRVWLQSPEFADKTQALGTFIRFGTSLPPRLSELAILVTGAAWKSGFEFWAHAPFATEGGLDAAIVEAIRVGKTPTFANEDERVLYTFAHELTYNRRVSQLTYDAAVKMFGEPTVVELVGILGYYTIVSMTINAFEIPLPPGEKDPFAQD